MTRTPAMTAAETDQQKYLNERVKQQLEWFSEQSKENKRRYQLLRLLQISLGIVVSTTGVYIEAIPHGIVVLSVIGALISLSAAWETVFDHQNNWIRYRRVKEALNREKLHYENHSGPYRRAASNASESDAMFTLFVERVEGLLSDEVDEWSSDSGKDGTDPQAPPSA